MEVYASFDELLKKEKIKFLIGEKLSRYSTVSIGGSCDRTVFPCSEEELLKTLDISKRCGYNPMILGAGSNTLISDSGVRGVVIITRCAKGVSVEKWNGDFAYVRAECGVSLSSLCAFCLEHGLGGLEFLCDIPGTVGGAVTMNAGCFGKSIASVLQSAYVEKDNFTMDFPLKQCGFGYRSSVFNNTSAVITSALFRAESTKKEVIKERLRRYKEMRVIQPKGKSLGSVFKNGDIPSAKLIEACGLKGLRVGGAFVSTRHANFIINDGSATACDVTDLIAFVKTVVKERTGVTLTEEIKYMGDF